MNRKKKINSILNKRLKKINAKIAPANKGKYISKAERARLEAEQAIETANNELAASE